MSSDNDYNVYLVPSGISKVDSRDDVDLTSPFWGLYPIMLSPMKGISGIDIVIEMGRNNCFGILHKFGTPEERIFNIRKVEESGVLFGVAIGAGEEDFDVELDIATCAYERGAKLICVDLANGYLSRLERIGSRLRARFGDDIALMCGNVITGEGSDFLKRAGFDFIRVGIGGSKVCTTRIVTGVGRNNLSAIHDCSGTDAFIVADGGIDEPGKAVKSFAYGADFVMMGSTLAYANESESQDTIYGMASERLQREEGKLMKSVEGIEIKLDISQKKPLKEILDYFLGGIRSACSILGCDSYEDLHWKAQVLEHDQ